MKVFCVDFTGEYRERLSDLDPIFPGPTKKETQDLATKIFDAETGPTGQARKRKFWMKR